MASANFMEEGIVADVDESSANFTLGCADTQLVKSSPSVRNQQTQTVSIEPTQINLNEGTSIKHCESTIVTDSMNADTGTSVETPNCPSNQGNALNQAINDTARPNFTSINNPECGVKKVCPMINHSFKTVSQEGSVGTFNNNITANNNPKITPSSMNHNKPVGKALAIQSTVSSSQKPVTTIASDLSVSPSTSVRGLDSQAEAPIGWQHNLTDRSPRVSSVNAHQSMNANCVRGASPVHLDVNNLPPRVMVVAPHIVGGRPVQPGQTTVQTFQGLTPGAQRNFMLKTENGQYHFLGVGPTATSVTGQQTFASSGITGNNANGFRVQTVTNATTNQNSRIQNNVSSVTTTPRTATVAPNTIDTQRVTMAQTKEKCRKFLVNLLELSSREQEAVERNVRTLIQELVDAKVEPEIFCGRLEILLHASPQPCLIGFLKKSLPLLRQSMVNKELIINGITPPSASVVFSTATIVNSTHSPQIRGQMQMTANP